MAHMLFILLVLVCSVTYDVWTDQVGAVAGQPGEDQSKPRVDRVSLQEGLDPVD